MDPLGDLRIRFLTCRPGPGVLSRPQQNSPEGADRLQDEGNAVGPKPSRGQPMSPCFFAELTKVGATAVPTIRKPATKEAALMIVARSASHHPTGLSEARSGLSIAIVRRR